MHTGINTEQTESYHATLILLPVLSGVQGSSHGHLQSFSVLYYVDTDGGAGLVRVRPSSAMPPTDTDPGTLRHFSMLDAYPETRSPDPPRRY